MPISVTTVFVGHFFPRLGGRLEGGFCCYTATACDNVLAKWLPADCTIQNLLSYKRLHLFLCIADTLCVRGVFVGGQFNNKWMVGFYCGMLAWIELFLLYRLLCINYSTKLYEWWLIQQQPVKWTVPMRYRTANWIALCNQCSVQIRSNCIVDSHVVCGEAILLMTIASSLQRFLCVVLVVI